MEKDFDGWNEQKKRTHATKHDLYFYEREIWWCAFGVNVGDEQDGTGEAFGRPVLIVRKYNPNIFLGVPLSTTQKIGAYYFSVGSVEERKAVAILSQVRLLDAKRLINRAGTLEIHLFERLVEKLIEVNFGCITKSSPPHKRG